MNGFYQQRDMNSHTISISVVGMNDKEATTEQIWALIDLLTLLMQQYNITPDHVVDYGCVAYPYGRRDVQYFLPWQELADNHLAIQPNDDDIPDVSIFHSDDYLIMWVSAALLKIGFICPITYDKNNQDFIVALKTFQYFFLCDRHDGVISFETIKYIHSIMKQKEDICPMLKTLFPSRLQELNLISELNRKSFLDKYYGILTDNSNHLSIKQDDEN